MLSLEQLRKVDPDLEAMSDEELMELRAGLYETAQIAFEAWHAEKGGSKVPVWSSSTDLESDRI